MNQQEMVDKVKNEAKKRVEARISVFKNDLNEAFKKLTGKKQWFSLESGDLRVEIMKSFFGPESSTSWPKILYDKEEADIFDNLLNPDSKRTQIL